MFVFTTEYFCKGCLHLRLSFLDETKVCGNCGSEDIITGKPYELNKEELKKQYELRTSKKDQTDVEHTKLT